MLLDTHPTDYVLAAQCPVTGEWLRVGHRVGQAVYGFSFATPKDWRTPARPPRYIYAKVFAKFSPSTGKIVGV